MSWKQNGSYPESMFGIEFREKYEDIAKQLSDERGFYDFTKSFTKDGYTYKAKQVIAKKDGRQYVFVERVKVEAAQTSLTPEQQRQLDIQRAHAENMQANKDLVQAINRLASAVEVCSTAINKLENMKAEGGDLG